MTHCATCGKQLEQYELNLNRKGMLCHEENGVTYYACLLHGNLQDAWALALTYASIMSIINSLLEVERR